MLSDSKPAALLEATVEVGLNAPFGARCFLTRMLRALAASEARSLNAPFGARCFLTPNFDEGRPGGDRPNAPFGARCFLTA